MIKYYVIIMALSIAATMIMVKPVSSEDSKGFSVYPIGVVRKVEEKTKIVLYKQYEPGLLGLNDFSHIYVYYWFDRNDTPEKRATLQVHPKGNRANPLRGVFATRSPARPNLIAMSLCKIMSVEGNVIEVDRIDAFADTPVIDIKPHIPDNDVAENPRMPDWLHKIIENDK